MVEVERSTHFDRPLGTRMFHLVTVLFGAWMVSVALFVLAGPPSGAELDTNAGGLALLVPPLVTAIVGDLGLRRLDIHAGRAWLLPSFAAALTLVLWVGHFLALAAVAGLGWPPELWGGAIGMAVLSAVGLATLVRPTSAIPRPVGVGEEGVLPCS